MKRSAIFLSAGVPEQPVPDSGEKPRPGTEDIRHVEIREAVVALVATITRERLLVFGGHPAISPLVEHAARSMGTTENVHIFQSRYCEEESPEEAARFQNFHWTDRREDREESLSLMRNKMLAFDRYGAAFFIGGMEGILAEYRMFRGEHTNAMTFPIESTGGASAILWRELEPDMAPDVHRDLSANTRYGSLFRKLLRDVD
ncbi:MAG: hypothetical protein AAF492_03080 [Verrucomicrobiota bacterium]